MKIQLENALGKQTDKLGRGLLLINSLITSYLSVRLLLIIPAINIYLDYSNRA